MREQLNGFDERIVLLYARGMTTRDIQAHFVETYDVEVSASVISQVSNAVMDEVKQWQQRPLDSLYPIVYLDCLVICSRDSGAVQNKLVYLALGIIYGGRKRAIGYLDSSERGG